MKQLILSVGTICFLIACSPKQKLITDNTGKPVPQITWDEPTQQLGKIYKGEQRELEYHFTNTGSADLEIELVTACNCMSLDWTRSKVAPGGRGIVKVTFDSSAQKLGPLKKTIDVIANTDPIVVEAFFTVEILYKNKG